MGPKDSEIIARRRADQYWQHFIYTGWIKVFDLDKQNNEEVVLWLEHRVNGKLHCENGPAVIYYDGQKEWYLNDEEVSAMEVFEKMSDEDKEQALWELDEWK